jgi:hypothetical protein
VGEIVLTIRGKVARLPDFLPARGWTLHSKGYLIYTSRGTHPWIRRGEYAHRAVFMHLLGTDRLMDGWQVHHQDFDKLNCLPMNLLYAPSAFNPSCALRDAFTGEFMSYAQYERRYGHNDYNAMPEWVTSAA